MECSELTERVVARLSGLDGDSGPGDLASHLTSCAACHAEAVEIERAWAALGSDSDAPVTPELRRRTLALIEDEMLRARIREFKPRARWPRLAAQAAALLVACAAGFFVARRGPDVSGSAAAPASTPATMLRDNPRLANVSYRAGADGKLEVGFDVTNRKTVSGRPNDPEMTRLLAYLLSHNAETAGEKSRAIELVSEHYRSGTAASPDIVAALTATLRTDPNPGVRKKAADALAAFTTTPEIRAAFLEALRADRNPAVRLTAIEALAASAKDAPDPKTIESLREKAQDPAENGFVRARAASALRNF
ncbi:MAG: HEAT repeat domain-containing protein [Thermoanaerobaculia bacterium]